jgi:hypothetical protein
MKEEEGKKNKILRGENMATANNEGEKKEAKKESLEQEK